MIHGLKFNTWKAKSLFSVKSLWSFERGEGRERAALVLTDNHMEPMRGTDLAMVVRGHEVRGLNIHDGNIHQIRRGARVLARRAAEGRSGGIVFGVNILPQEAKALVRVPIILNSAGPASFDCGHPDGQEVAHLLETGVIGHAIQKPFGVSDLARAVRKASIKTLMHR